MKDFRECMDIVKNATYVDTPDEYIFESLKERLNHRQIERLIEYYKEYHKSHAIKGVMRDINKQFPKEVVEQARKVAVCENIKERYRKSLVMRKRYAKTLKRWREKVEFEKWMEQHRPTVKTRKPKPKKTFWNVSTKTAKHRQSKYK